MAFDGSDFKGLDSDAVAPGEVLDTWLEHRLRGNEYYLLRGHESISWQPFAGSSDPTDYQSGDRTFASLEWSTILCVPWVFETTHTKLILDLYYRVGSSGGDDVDYDLRVDLLDRSQRTLGQARVTLVSTEALSPTWRTTRVEVEVSEHINARQTGWLVVWGKSKVDSEHVVDDVDFTGSLAWYTDTSPWKDKTASTPPSPFFETEVALIGQTNPDGTTNPLKVDVFHASEVEAFGLPCAVTTGRLDSTITYKIHRLSYLQVRSITIEDVHDPTRIGISSEAIRANIPVRGSAATAHARLAREAEARPRCMWIGPEPTFGDAEEQADFWQDYRWAQRWRFVDADDATASPASLSKGSVSFRSEDPLVDVWLDIMGVQLAAYPSSGIQWRAETPVTFEQIKGNAARATWDLTVTFDQLTGGGGWESATELGTVSKQFRFEHFREDRSGAWPFFWQQHVLTQAVADNLNICYREGQLYEADLPFIRRVRLSLPLSNLDTLAKLSRPTRMRLEAQYINDSGVYGDDIDGRFPADSQYLRLVCVGASVWQKKEFSR